MRHKRLLRNFYHHILNRCSTYNRLGVRVGLFAGDHVTPANFPKDQIGALRKPESFAALIRILSLRRPLLPPQNKPDYCTLIQCQTPCGENKNMENKKLRNI